jgi:ribosomal protein S18 acetylase RimI-like enzyme
VPNASRTVAVANLAERAVVRAGRYLTRMIDQVHLRLARAEEFEPFVQAVLAQDVEDMVANAAMTRDEAEDKSERDCAAILPDGFATHGHSFYFIEDAIRTIPLGRLWLAETGSGIYLYEISLEPSVRGRGLGRQVMFLVERETRVRHLDRIELNVFAGNRPARNLYQSMGYSEVAVRMRKRL